MGVISLKVMCIGYWFKRNVGQLGFIFWFSGKNDDNGAISSKFFFCAGVLSPAWVLVFVTHFSFRSLF
jgi:hypothetical protein